MRKEGNTEMNHMDKVCRLSGLELTEEFSILKKRPDIRLTVRNPYYFTDEGMTDGSGRLDNTLLADLITGTLVIKKSGRKASE